MASWAERRSTSATTSWSFSTEARATGASRSELIRRAVRSAFGEKTKADRLEALSASAGSWSGERLTGADYVDGLRGDLDERLRRLGVE